MYKFEYKPKSGDISKFEDEYFEIIKSKIIKVSAYDYLFKEILFIKVDKINEDIHKEYIDKFKQIKILKDCKFKYEKLQPLIADFFSRKLIFKICPYCSIDYINSFQEYLTFYSSFDEFIKDAEYEELIKLKGIGNKTAKKIVNNRNYKLKNSNTLEKNFKNLNIKEEYYNHFTLDHVFPKSKFPLFQLSIYNLLPACYSCNCKFKKNNYFNNNLIPSSDNFNLLENFDYSIQFDKANELKIDLKIKDSDNSAEYKRFLRIFKIKGRVSEHIEIVNNYVDLQQKYNEKKIEEISAQLNITVNNVKEMIFGKELFQDNGNDIPLFKFKKDIAKQLKIIE